MISQDKCNESCIAVDNLSTKICVPSETKHCIKYARIRVFSDPYSSYTGEYGRIRVTENPYSRIFYAVKDVNVTVFNMITKINEAKTFVKHNSCDCKCKFDSRACNSNQK